MSLKVALANKYRYLFSVITTLMVVYLLLLNNVAIAATANKLEGIRVWPSPDNTRVVLDLYQKPYYQTHYLTKPDRLVVDLSTTTNQTNLSKIKNSGSVIKRIRESASPKKGSFRLVIDLNQKSKAKIFSLPPAKPYGHRLVIDLPNNKKQTPTPSPLISSTEGRNIIVAIDAGHGGDDPGALGKYTYEKKITLQIAKRLKKRIDKQKGMQAFLIRTGDYFVNLNKRSEIARKGKADFLVSIHADGFTSSRPRGASVWVLSNRRATSELGRWMEKHEAHSELLGGAGDIIQGSDSVPFLNKMLLDMSMGNTMDVGYTIGSLVSKELSLVTKMHKKKPVHASLAVLKSPDIPSILVEAGFITNRTEERLLNQAQFQDKIANAVFRGIYKHFTQSPPQDTLFAQKKRLIKHTVRGGESLSMLAQRYSVGVGELKKFNNLKSNSLRIGQVLNIPPNYQVNIKPEPVKQRELPQAQAVSKPQIHTVKRGESLSVIAKRYGKSTSELKSYNKLRSTSLAVGQKIKIPGSSVNTASTAADKTPPAALQPRTHIVKRGESLSVIAKRYGKTTTQLKSYNKLRSTSLAVGQKIKIPGSAVNTVNMAQNKVNAVQKPRTHIVKRGESLSVIAKRYGKTTGELKSYNKLRSTSLAIGQRIKIPGEGTAQTVTKTAKTTPSLHVVKSGESLSVIAARYDRSTQQLKAYNKLTSSKLRVGQKLKIPNANFKAPSLPSVHIVQRGQSLSVIAQKYGTTAQQLIAYNKLRSNSLAIGQKLRIPTKKIEQTQHKVRSGESLSVIAKRYGTTTNAIMLANKLRSHSLAIGQVLTIPLS